VLFEDGRIDRVSIPDAMDAVIYEYHRLMGRD
jgi:hypothetical protein